MRRVLLPHHFSDHALPLERTIRAFGGHSMGTSWSVQLLADGERASLQRDLQRQLDEVVAQMSHWEDDSCLARYNRAAPGSWHDLPAEFFQVLACALDVARASGGAYDPGAGALVNRWGFGPLRRHDQPGFVAPTADEVAALLAQGRVAIDPLGRRAFQPGGVLLDLSAVAKGYGVDRLAEYLEGQAIHHYLVEVGGELRGAGTKPDGQPWWVALEQIGASGRTGQMVLALHGLAVATSGDYRRFFERDGQRFSHTLDPRSGAPIANGLASVTVVHGACMAADAWSTALTVLGPEAGLALAERLGLCARFLVRTDTGLREYLSSPMRAMLEP
ncbi:thiamine biosynthesis lipoprotein [Oxalobacteraceae bacterium GrIS 1.11]